MDAKLWKTFSISKKVILALGELVEDTLVSGTPRFMYSYTLRAIAKRVDERERKRAARALAELKDRHLISFHQKSNGSIVNLTTKGRKLIAQYEFAALTIRRPAAWDKKWRIIMYDLPVRYQRSSQALSRKLHQLGLFKLQKSVWISPFPCDKELKLVCNIFGIPMGENIKQLITSELPNEKEARVFFGL